MKIRTGELEVIGSGTVQSSGMNDVEFVLSEAPPMVIVARVRKTDDGKTAIELSVESSERMVFVFSTLTPLTSARPKLLKLEPCTVESFLQGHC